MAESNPNPALPQRKQYQTEGPARPGEASPVPYHYTPEYGREQADGARWQRTTPSERRADLPAPQPGFGPGKPSGGANNGAGK